jgi:hypothetical protein
MTMSVKVADWTSRILAQGLLGATPSDPKDRWQLEAYQQYKAKLGSPDYPCFFGQSGEAHGEMLYTFVAQRSLDDLLANMQQFIRLIGTQQYKRSSLIAFFEPDSSIANHASFVARFWQILQYLHDRDSDPATHRMPDDPLWEFSFEGSEMFVVGASPTYRRRLSRNLGPGIVLVFQPRFLFIDPVTAQPIPAPVRQRIHGRMLAYDGLPVHPDIGFYGDVANREWKQYALPDDNEPEAGSCPYHSSRGDDSAMDCGGG